MAIMKFESLVYSDFSYLKEFEPPNWGDLVLAGIRRILCSNASGNIFGGTVLFSVLSYAQVREEISISKGAKR